jgi:hypothetical protein
VTASLPPGLPGNGFFKATDALGPLNLLGGGGIYVQELTGARINHVLDAISWPTADRDIDVGQSVVEAISYTVGDTNFVLQHLQDVADSELGQFYMSGDGKAVFQDRHFRLSPPSSIPQAIYGDADAPGQSELEYVEITPEVSKERIQNNWSVTTSTGTYTASDGTSILDFFSRDGSRSTLLADPVDAQAQAGALLFAYKDPHLRIDSMEVHPVRDYQLLFNGLSFDISTKITVKGRPKNILTGETTPFMGDFFIEQIGWDITQQEWNYKWQLSPASATTYLTLDDAVLGKLDSNAIGY